tara:strand:- start:715 stop:1080 length:366 start_codon:yes stop_codon:yes gene_type:complete
MRPYVEPSWGWDEEIQSKGFDEQLGAENFKIVSIEESDIGGFCLKYREDCLWLDMLLIEPSHQCKGTGGLVMKHIHALAESNNLPVRLCSIKANPATNFYRHLGYIEYKEDATLSYLERGS